MMWNQRTETIQPKKMYVEWYKTAHKWRKQQDDARNQTYRIYSMAFFLILPQSNCFAEWMRLTNIADFVWVSPSVSIWRQLCSTMHSAYHIINMIWPKICWKSIEKKLFLQTHSKWLAVRAASATTSTAVTAVQGCQTHWYDVGHDFGTFKSKKWMNWITFVMRTFPHWSQNSNFRDIESNWMADFHTAAV